MIDILKNHSLEKYTTFHIGGRAQYFTTCTTEEEAKEAIYFANSKSIPFWVLGKGSNTLFPSGLIPCLFIENRLQELHVSNEIVEVGSGYSFSLLGSKTAKLGLSGLEFASAIPASVGGAIFMNAGANNQETKDTLFSVTFLHEDGKCQTLLKDEIEFEYRKSSFQMMKGMILFATFHLKKDPDARKRQLSMLETRMEKQPLKEKSAGCIFRNPEGISAAFLIDSCKLKGVQIGGAAVSKKHANFIINKGLAKESDVLALVRHIQEVVEREKGILLEPEIRVFRERV